MNSVEHLTVFLKIEVLLYAKRERIALIQWQIKITSVHRLFQFNNSTGLIEMLFKIYFVSENFLVPGCGLCKNLTCPNHGSQMEVYFKLAR